MKNLPRGERAHEYQISLHCHLCVWAPDSIINTEFQPSFGIFIFLDSVQIGKKDGKIRELKLCNMFVSASQIAFRVKIFQFIFLATFITVVIARE